MKNAGSITVALLVMAGGLVSAAAQTTGPYYNITAMDYPLHERFPNTQRFAFTQGLPTLTSPEMESLSGAIATDGAGRIAGLVYARVYFAGPINHSNNYGAFTITVNGNTGNRGTNPLVKINLHGNGYSFDGVSNHPNANLTLTFTSTNKLVDVPPTVVTVNSTNYSVTYLDGSTQLFTDGPATRTNSAFTFLSGRMKGNIRPGNKSPVNGGNQLKIDQTEALVSGGTIWVVMNDTNLVEQPLSGGLGLNVLTNIDAQVIQPLPGSKLFLNANVGSELELFSGRGSANTNTLRWSASFSGVAFAHGSTLQANGDLGPVIVAYQPTTDTTNFPSGYFPLFVPKGIQRMTITAGKIYGQKYRKTDGISVPPPEP
jgi:hypothetical protein